MKNYRFVVAASIISAGICTLNSCTSSTSPNSLSSSQYFVVPDSITTTLYNNVSFSLRTTDLTAQTYKYVWNFGDGTPSDSIINSNLTDHNFSVAGMFKVTAKVFDPQNRLLGSALAKVFVPLPTGKIALQQHAYSVNNDIDRIIFQASASPDSIRPQLSYYWEVTDQAGVPYQSGQDTLSHVFTEAGTFWVKVKAMYGSYLIGSDSAVVTVTLPFVTAADLANMGSVTATLTGSPVSSVITLPLANGNGYTFSENGNSLTANYYYKLHQVVSPTVTTDTLKVRNISTTLIGDQRHIRLDNASLLDSFFLTGTSKSVEHLIRSTFKVDTLKLLYKTADSIVFQAPQTGHWDLLYSSVDSTFSSTSPPQERGIGCMSGFNIYISGRSYYEYYRGLTLVFRRKQ